MDIILDEIFDDLIEAIKLSATASQLNAIELACNARRWTLAEQEQADYRQAHTPAIDETVRNIEARRLQIAELKQQDTRPGRTVRTYPSQEEIRDRVRKFTDENLNVGREISSTPS